MKTEKWRVLLPNLKELELKLLNDTDNMISYSIEGLDHSLVLETWKDNTTEKFGEVWKIILTNPNASIEELYVNGYTVGNCDLFKNDNIYCGTREEIKKFFARGYKKEIEHLTAKHAETMPNLWLVHLVYYVLGNLKKFDDNYEVIISDKTFVETAKRSRKAKELKDKMIDLTTFCLAAVQAEIDVEHNFEDFDVEEEMFDKAVEILVEKFDIDEDDYRSNKLYPEDDAEEWNRINLLNSAIFIKKEILN